MKSIVFLLGTASAIKQRSLVELQEDPICSSAAGCYTHHYKDEGKTPYPVDYYVPNFGQDDDVKSSLNFASQAEVDREHPWVIIPKKDQPKPHPMDYYVPNFGRDKDIDSSDHSLQVAEKQLGHQWDFKFTEKKDNGVVPFYLGHRPMDDDIASTLNFASKAEVKLGHQWDVFKE